MIQSAHIIVVIVFLSLIGLEAIISSVNTLRLYKRPDTWVNILIGLLNVFATVAYRGVTLYAYYKAFELAIFDLKHTIVYWLGLLLLTDLIAYGFHVLGHRCRFFWASHVIHHSSEYYNLSTAARIPVTNFFYRFIFYAPLCLLGFQPLHVLIMESVVYLYNFYLHTELVRKLGWLELILSTPSHHRVHHGRDEKYIDKNFGSIFIIWDRIFGTFQKEEERPDYGITKPISSHNFFRIITHEWIDMARELRKSRGIPSVVRVIFGAP